MTVGQAIFLSSSGKQVAIDFRLADTSERQRHGFQNVCSETIVKTSILFQFSSPVIPSFHMNNVVAPLDIAFIDEMGQITDIHLMETYRLLDLKKPTYSPSKPVRYAFEARAGYFAEHDIKVGDQVLISSIKSN